MSQLPSELISALERAARADDEPAFDAAFGELLARTRSASASKPSLREHVAERLPNALGSGSGVRPIPAQSLAARSGRAVQLGRSLGLVAVGVALGLSWNHAASWWSSEPESHEYVLEAQAPAAESQASSLTGSASSSAVASPATRAAPREPTLDEARSSPAPVDEPRAIKMPSTPLATANRPVPRQPEVSPTSRIESLRFAVEQLRKAQLFLRASEPARALEALDILDARVPLDVLREEREVTRALAWCDAGEVSKASALARAVLERAPQSAYALSLRESCANAGPKSPTSNPQLLEEMRA